jgi:hypothetical protein
MDAVRDPSKRMRRLEVLEGYVMSAQRRNRIDLLNVWNEMVGMRGAEVFGDGRPPRDSYTYERPLISGRIDLYAADLIDFSQPDEEGLLIHLRPTLRP